MSFISKDFLNADANCPDYVITASEMIEMLEIKEMTAFVLFLQMLGCKVLVLRSTLSN